MAYEESGTHYVIARNEQEAARNILTYPYVVEYADSSALVARLEEVRDRFGEDFDVFVVSTKVSVDTRASHLVESKHNETE